MGRQPVPYWSLIGTLLLFIVLLLAGSGCGAKNRPPVARIVEPPNNARLTDKAVRFVGEATDPDGDETVRSTIWSFGDGRQEQGTALDHTYEVGGDYTVRFTVTDDQGASDTAAIRLHIDQEPLAVAWASLPQTGGQELAHLKFVWGPAPLEVRFQGSASSDPDGEIVAHRWDFGDGTQSDDWDPIHTYTTPGEYRAVLTVTDDDGVSSTDYVMVRVEAVPLSAAEVLGVPVPPYRLYDGKTIGGTETSKAVLYRYVLEPDEGAEPVGRDQIRAALVDATLQAAQHPEIGRVTVYLFDAVVEGFMDPGDYRHYLGMSLWERPGQALQGLALARHVADNAELTYNEGYLQGTAPVVVGYSLTQAPITPEDPRCGPLCESSQVTYVSLVLEPEAPCREQALNTIQAVLHRALGAPGGYALNIYGDRVGNTLAVGLWAVEVDISQISLDLIALKPDSWDIEGETLKLKFVQELSACPPSP